MMTVDGRKSDRSGKAATGNKDALNVFLQNILSSQEVKGSTNKGGIDQVKQFSPSLTLTENTPVIKQMPVRVYKGIIQIMKRKRLRQINGHGNNSSQKWANSNNKRPLSQHSEYGGDFDDTLEEPEYGESIRNDTISPSVIIP